MARPEFSDGELENLKQCNTNEDFDESHLEHVNNHSQVDVLSLEKWDKYVRCSLSGCSRFLTQGIERVFYFYGRTVATYPALFIFFCLVLTGMCSIGLLKFQTENKPFKLWIPQDSDFIRISEWQAKNFPNKYRYHIALYEADNVLNKHALLELLRVHEAVAGTVGKVTAEDVLGESQGDASANDTSTNSDGVVREVPWQDVCAKLPSLSNFSLFGRRKRSPQNNFVMESHNFFEIIPKVNHKHLDYRNFEQRINEKSIKNIFMFDHVEKLNEDSVRSNLRVRPRCSSNICCHCRLGNKTRCDIPLSKCISKKHEFYKKFKVSPKNALDKKQQKFYYDLYCESIKPFKEMNTYNDINDYNSKYVTNNNGGPIAAAVPVMSSKATNSGDVSLDFTALLQRFKRQGDQDWSTYLPRGSYCSFLDQIGKECFEKSILEIWGYDRGLLESLSQEDIIEAVNSRDTSVIFGVQTNFTEYLGGVTRDETGRVVAAKAMTQVWLSAINPDRVVKGKYIDSFGTGVEVDVDGYKWEEEFIKTILNDTGRTEGVNVYVMSAASFGKITDETIQGDLGLLILGFTVVFIYVQIMLGKFNYVETRPFLSFMGITAVEMSIVISYGLSSALGFKYSPMNSILPFLLLGLGIDDMFVIMQAWNNLTPEERAETLPVRVGCAMRHAGASIAMTSATDFVAFAIGSGTVLPALQSFCIFAAIGIAAMFFLQATFFVAWFTFDQRRIESKHSGLICCWKMSPDYRPNECSQRDICQTFFGDIYAKFLLKPTVKVSVLLCTATLFGVSCWGLTNLRQEFNAIWFVPNDSYLYDFFLKHVQYFPSSGDRGIIYFGNVSLLEELPQIEKFIDALEANYYVGEVDSWYKSYKRYFEEQGYAVPDSLATESEFQDDLGLFLFSPSGSRYRNKNFKFSSPLSCIEPAPAVVASSIDFTYNRMSETSMKLAAMHSVKDLAKTTNISGFVDAFAPVHSGWETDEVIEKELYKNMSLALLVVFLITFALIASLVQSLYVLSCVVMTLVDVGAVMHWWGLTIDTVSCIHLVLAIGLSVDYAAHVGHTFMTVQGSRNTRARLTLARIGPAVLNGGFSTFLAFVFLANSNSHVFTTFFKIFFGVCLFGLFHGLVYLPVLLSLVGPASYDLLDLRSTKSIWDCDGVPASYGGDASAAGGGVGGDTRVDDCEMRAVTTAV